MRFSIPIGPVRVVQRTCNRRLLYIDQGPDPHGSEAIASGSGPAAGGAAAERCVEEGESLMDMPRSPARKPSEASLLGRGSPLRPADLTDRAAETRRVHVAAVSGRVVRTRVQAHSDAAQAGLAAPIAPIRRQRPGCRDRPSFGSCSRCRHGNASTEDVLRSFRANEVPGRLCVSGTTQDRVAQHGLMNRAPVGSSMLERPPREVLPVTEPRDMSTIKHSEARSERWMRSPNSIRVAMLRIAAMVSPIFDRTTPHGDDQHAEPATRSRSGAERLVDHPH
jgi:hypothetical protein